jgi:hypothetical protein
MADIERLHFKIGLTSTYWDKHPIYSILLNDEIIETREISAPPGETFFVEFDRDVVEGSSALKIRLENKDWTDTIENEDKTAIIKDILLSIKCIEIEKIDLGELIWKKSIFTGDDPDRPVLDKCVDLGWNGTWELKFENPFYIWLLENI